MDEPAEYKIDSLADFAKVPAERMNDCLSDFAQWVHLVREHAALSAEFEKAFGAPGHIVTESFTWVDDGKPGMSELRISTLDGEEVGSIRL